MKRIFCALLAIAVALPVFVSAIAQDEEEAVYGYGTVAEIRKENNEIVVKEYDWDNDEEIETTYIIHPDVELENSDAWKNIPEGSYIDLEYVTDAAGKKTITYIYVYEPDSGQTE